MGVDGGGLDGGLRVEFGFLWKCFEKFQNFQQARKKRSHIFG